MLYSSRSRSGFNLQLQESGRRFKGKKMSGLMRYAHGNESRDFFKEIQLPLVALLQTSVLFLERILQSL